MASRFPRRHPRTTLPTTLTLTLLTFALMAASCEGVDPLLNGSQEPEIRIGSIQLDPETVSLGPGDEVLLLASLADPDGEPLGPQADAPTITWTSMDPEIASVSASGLVRAGSAGSTQVTARAGNIEAQGTVIVQPVRGDVAVEDRDIGIAGVVGTALPDTVSARVVGPTGSGVPGVSVIFLPAPHAGSTSPTLALTDENGYAHTRWVLGTRAGMQEVLAMVPLPGHTVFAEEDTVASDSTVAASKGNPRNPTGRLRGWAQPGPADQVVVTPDNPTILIGDSLDFEVEAYDQHGNLLEAPSVIWSSRPPDVATVDDDGLAQGHAEGTATIEAIVDDAIGSSALSIEATDDEAPPPGTSASVVISPDSVVIDGVGGIVQMSAEATDADGLAVSDASFEWSSSDPEIATVTQEGLVEAKAIGTAIIVAATMCGTAACEGSAPLSAEDHAPPGVVTDLRVSESSDSSLTVAFSEVDDGTGEPADYALRYGSPSIDWGPASSTEVSLSGSAIGEERTYEYSGLDPNTAYEFQLVAYRGTLGAGATFGDLSNEAAGTTEAANPGTAESLTISPSNATITGVGNSFQFTAEAKDEDGNTVPDVSIEWSSSNPDVATVNQEGLVQANAVGTALIIAAATCGTTACESTAPTEVSGQHSPSERYPNEPAGFEPWFEHDWQTFPDCDGAGCDMPASGVGWFKAWATNSRLQNATLISDPDAPHGRERSVRIRAAEGTGSGTDFFSLALRSSDQNNPEARHHEHATQLQKWYISLWIQYEPNPADGMWEMFTHQLRVFSMNRQLQTGAILGGWTFRTHNDPIESDTFQSYRLWGYAEPPGSTSTFRGTTPGPSIGPWYHMEFLFDRTVKDPPLFAEGEDGVGPMAVKVWINGEPLIDEVVQEWYAVAPFMELFLNFNRSGGEVRARDDWMRLGDVYISGELYSGTYP